MRITAEAMIATLDAAFPVQRVADAFADPFEAGWDEAEGRIGARINDIGDIVNNAMQNATTGGTGDVRHAGEASQIAERWRNDAEKLMEGAQFLLAAGQDIRRGMGLLGEGGTLTEITDLIETLQRGEETLVETYQRVVASVRLVEQTLGAFNVASGRTRTEFVEFSDELVASLGGLQNATTALQQFSDAFGQIGGMAEQQAAMARQNRAGLLEQIGLSADTTAEEFITLFTAALPDLTAAEVADWVAAGQPLAAVSLALRDMRQQLEGGESLAEQINRQIQAIAALGASEAELAEAREIGNQILANALRDFMRPIEQELAEYNGDSYAFRVAEINRATDEAIRQATQLGASEEQLNMIRQRGTNQIEAIARELEDFMFGIEGQIAEIEGHPVSHHLKEIARQMEANIRQARGLGASETQLARIRRLAGMQMTQAINELRMSIKSLVFDFYNTGDESPDSFAEASTSAYERQRAAAESLYEQEMKRYEDAQDAIKNIKKFLTDLEIGELSPGSWQDRLGAARKNFMDLYQRALNGDADALNEITGAAQQFLELGSEFYGSTTGYADIYDMVTSMLKNLNGTLEEVKQPTPLPADTGGSGSSGGGSTTESERERIQREAQRFQQALQIAQQIGDLADALNVSVLDLMDEFGVKLTDLASALGINVNKLTKDTAFSLQMLSGALGMSMNSLISQLGIKVGDLATAFGVSLTDFSGKALKVLAEFSSIMETDLVTMADNLGIAIGDLADGLATAITEGVGALPDLPASITEGLKPFISAIATAENATELRSAINALGTFVSTLPEDQREQLRPVLEDLGIMVGDAVVETEAQTLQAMKKSLDWVGGALGAINTTLQFHNPTGAINTGNNLLTTISNSLRTLNTTTAQIRDGLGFSADPAPPKSETLSPQGAYTWAEGSFVEGYSAASHYSTVATQQEEAIQQAEAVVEKLEELNVNVGAKLDSLNQKQAVSNSNTTSMKNTARRQSIAGTTRTKKGRTR